MQRKTAGKPTDPIFPSHLGPLLLTSGASHLIDATHKVPRHPGLPPEEHRGFPARLSVPQPSAPGHVGRCPGWEEEVGAGMGFRTHQESPQETWRADLGNRGESRILPVSPALGKAERLIESRAVQLRRWGASVRMAKGGAPSPGRTCGGHQPCALKSHFCRLQRCGQR